MHHTKTVKDYLWEYFLIIIGSMLYAAGLRFFYLDVTKQRAGA